MSTKFPKASVPQPKYNIGEMLIFFKETERGRQKDAAKVESIHIDILGMNDNQKSIQYKLAGHEDLLGENAIERRVTL